jgi:hypothetical protein
MILPVAALVAGSESEPVVEVVPVVVVAAPVELR